MTLKVCAVYDSKAEAYSRPFFAATTGVAIRQFSAAVEDQQHEFNRFAEDYTLFELAEFDEQAGVFLNLETPKSLLQAHALKASFGMKDGGNER